jgi:DNA-binding protein HU-beta
LTKSDFVDRISGKFDSKRAAADAIDTVLDGITDTLASGGEVNFTGFGKFSVAERAPRQGVNPRTGERITIAGGRVPKFSAGAGLKSKVKG